MPPRPGIPTWQEQFVSGARIPRMTPVQGITGQMLDLVAGKSDGLLRQALKANTDKEAEQQLAAGRAAGIQAAKAGAAPPKAQTGTFEFLFGPAPQDAAFDQGARSGFLAGISNQVKSGLADVADASGGDEKKFADGVDQLRGRYSHLPPELAGDIDLEIENGAVAYAQGIRRTNAARAREASTLAVRDTLNTLAIEAQNASRAGNVEEAQKARARWAATSAAGVQDGALSGEYVADQARRLDSEMMQQGVLGQFFDAARNDGYLAARRYQQDVRRQATQLGITPDAVDALDRTMERELDAMHADELRAERAAERGRKTAGDGAFKELVDLRAAGRLTFEELERRRPRLSDSQYGQGYTMLQSDLDRSDRARTDPMLYSDLRTRQLRGENVLEDAQRAYSNGQLNYDAFNKIVSENEEVITEADRRAREHIKDMVKSSGMFAGADEAQRHAQADAEYDDWVRRERAAGREPSGEERMSRAKYLGSVWRAAGTPPPRENPAFIVSRDGKTDWPATLQATEAARQRNEITDQDLMREKKKIAEAVRAEQAQAAAEAAAAANKTKRPPQQ